MNLSPIWLCLPPLRVTELMYSSGDWGYLLTIWLSLLLLLQMNALTFSLSDYAYLLFRWLSLLCLQLTSSSGDWACILFRRLGLPFLRLHLATCQVTGLTSFTDNCFFMWLSIVTNFTSYYITELISSSGNWVYVLFKWLNSLPVKVNVLTSSSSD